MVNTVCVDMDPEETAKAESPSLIAAYIWMICDAHYYINVIITMPHGFYMNSIACY
jgi:hypothetical protein